jgi:PEP-CTERM motif
VLRRILYLLPVVLLGTCVTVHAASVVCSMQIGNTGPFYSQDCNNPLLTPTSALSWANVLPATAGMVPGPLTSSIDGDSFAVTSNADFVGLDNTALAWNGSAWVPAFLVTTAATFAGHFNSETTPPGPPPEGVLGDNLLGALAAPGTNNSNTTVTLTFAAALSFVEFQVSNLQGTNSNFTAELIAFDSSGHVLGTYQVVDTGGGGQCAGLANTAGPQPCNDAPYVQFYDPEDNIASVELIMNDTAGALLDTLSVAGAPVPEPSSAAIFAIGMLLVALGSRRGYLRRLGFLRESTRE